MSCADKSGANSTTHTFNDRVATLKHVKAAGITTCSGGIIAIGKSDNDAINLALSLRELEVTSVPVNFLIPIPGNTFRLSPSFPQSPDKGDKEDKEDKEELQQLYPKSPKSPKSPFPESSS